MVQNFSKYLAALFFCASILSVESMDPPKQSQKVLSPSTLLTNPFNWNQELSHLINVHFKEQYKDLPENIKRHISGIDYIIPRPNHGLAHGMRQGFLALAILDGCEQVNPNEFTSLGTPDFIRWVQMKLKADPYFRQKVQLAASFQRTGRQSEVDVSTHLELLQKYEDQDAENFYQAAKNFIGSDHLFANEEELNLYKQAILKNSKNKDKPFSPNTKDLQYLRKIIWTSHTLDLRRLIKSGFDESTVIANATKSLFGAQTAFSDPNYKKSLIYPQFKKEENFMKRLWEYSGQYLQATGDRYDGEYSDIFFIQAQNPDKMVTALMKARKQLKSPPHPVGIFLYAACPSLVTQSKIKQNTQTSYEWCVLIKEQTDGTYSTLGGFASSFEDDADVAQRRVREESGGLYDIDPSTFDREKLTPVQMDEAPHELRPRSLNRLPNETLQQHQSRLALMGSSEEIARHDEKSSQGETLEELKMRRALEVPPSSVQDKADGKIINTLFFKQVPFYSASKILEEMKDHKTGGCAWVPVRRLLDVRDHSVQFTSRDGFFGGFEEGMAKEIINQPINLKVSSSLVHLLNQNDVKDYIKNKIVDKPTPMDLINRMKVHREFKSPVTSLPLPPANPNAFTMFDKYAHDVLGDTAGDTDSNLKQLVDKHNQQVKPILNLIDKDFAALTHIFYLINPDSEQTLLQMVNKEKELYPWFVFYHAVPADIYQVYELCTQFRSLLAGKSLKNNLILRALDEPFNLIQNIEDFYQKAEKQKTTITLDKTDLFRRQGLSVNLTLFGGLQDYIDSDLLSEYSIHRWLAGYSDIENPNVAEEFIAEFLSNFGIPKDRAKRYQDLYKEYYTSTHETDWNNPEDIKNLMLKTDNRSYTVMLQLFIHPSIIDQVTYFSKAGGSKILTLAEDTPQTLLTKMRSKTEKNYPFKYFQARLFLKPEYFHNQDYVKIFSYFSKHPEKPEKEYHQKLKKLVEEDLIFLLSSSSPLSKEGMATKHPLLTLEERVIGNSREQSDSDQEIIDWFSTHQTEALRSYYDKKPEKINTYLMNKHIASYSHEIEISKKGYSPIQLSLIYKNQEMLLYFIDKLDEGALKSFLSQNIPIQSRLGLKMKSAFDGIALNAFDPKAVVPKLYEKLGDKLFDYLFVKVRDDGVGYVMKTLDSMNLIPLSYLENLFSKPSYLRGLKHIQKISLSPEPQYNFLLIKDLPSNGIPEEGKIYLERMGDTLGYTLMTPNGKVIAHEPLKINIWEDVLDSILQGYSVIEDWRASVLAEILSKNHLSTKGLDEAKILLTKMVDDLWEAFKAMPFCTGKNLSEENQRYYNILFNEKEDNYEVIAEQFVINEFIFSYLKTVLHAIHFDELSPSDASYLYSLDLENDFVEHSIQRFFKLLKDFLSKRQTSHVNLISLAINYVDSKEKSVGPKDQKIFGLYSSWIYRLIHKEP